MEKKPKRKLTNMQIGEVSVVKSPANSQPFLFLKSKDKDKKVNIIKLDGPVTVTFKSDGKEKGTSIEVNDVPLKKVDSFSLYYSKPGDEGIEGQAVSISYSRKKEEGEGFQGVETFWLTKNKGDSLMITKFVEFMKKLSGKEDYSFERKEGELSEDATKAIQKALDTISDNYSDDAPEDLKSAIITLTEYAASAVPVEKQVETKVDTEVAKVDTKVAKEEDDEVDEKDDEKVDGDIAKDLKALLTSVKDVKDAVDKLETSIEDIDSRLETVEKSSGARQSVKGQKKLEKNEVAFPSLLDVD